MCHACVCMDLGAAYVHVFVFASVCLCVLTCVYLHVCTPVPTVHTTSCSKLEDAIYLSLTFAFSPRKPLAFDILQSRPHPTPPNKGLSPTGGRGL